MDTNAPLLNEYKLDFVLRRLPQTILGGVKLKFARKVPVYVYLGQIALFLMPAVLSGIFTVLATYDILEFSIGIYLCGSLLAVIVLVLNVASSAMQGKGVQHVQAENLLSEDDEVEFTSCCGMETVTFIIPGKNIKLNILFHSLLSGCLCSLTFWYLLPATLDPLFNETSVTVVLHVFGLLAYCIGQYPLTTSTPPETAAFGTQDRWELQACTRPIHIFLFVVVDIIARYVTGLEIVNQVCHIVFVFLPVFWTIGLLPPIDALLIWTVEQTLVLLFGGSPMATNLRLIVMVIASACSVAILYFLPTGIATMTIAACLGYILSIDIFGGFSQLSKKLHRGTSIQQHNQVRQNEGFMWRVRWKEILYHGMMVLMVAGLSAGLSYWKTLGASTPFDLSYVIMGCYVIELMLKDSQRVYMIYGVIRNKLYSSISSKSKKAKFQRFVGYLHRLIVCFVAPLLLVAYINLSASFEGSNDLTAVNSTDNALYFVSIVGMARALRWSWQGTSHALLEVCVLRLISFLWTPQSMAISTILLIISICRDRLSQMMHKFYFYFTLLVSSMADKKQRRNSSCGLLAVNVLFFILVLVVIVVATVLSAPLLPLFTIPVFLVGFPRPSKMWPAKVGESVCFNQDSVFYEHMAPHLATALRTCFANGCLGEPSLGSYYLLRYQDRLVWVTVLERGHCYCLINIKGLELQETSCHTVEAARLDDINTEAFDVGGRKPFCVGPTSVFNIYTPLVEVPLTTYSDARNVLTGVIDSPDTLEAVHSRFIYSLIWVLLKKTSETRKQKIHHESEHRNGQSNNNAKRGSTHDSVIIYENSPKDSDEHWLSDLEDDPKSKANPTHDQALSPRFSDGSNWDDSDSLFMDLTETPKQRVNLVHGARSGMGDNGLAPLDIVTTGDPINYNQNKAGGNGFGRIHLASESFSDLDFGMPVVDVNQGRNKGKEKLEDSTDTPQYQSSHSALFEMPDRWHRNSVDSSKISAIEDQFPLQWFRHVLSLFSDGKVIEDIQADHILQESYKRLVLGCFAVANVLGSDDMQATMRNIKHVFKLYHKDIPWSASSEWVTQSEDLKDAVLKSFRYAVKLAIDEMLLGGATDETELQEYFEDYDSNWYIGTEDDPAWGNAIHDEKTNLFSFGFDKLQNTYTSRVLTRQKCTAPIGSMNGEAVRGQWANLSLELLYMTNDDEERYSIQAHSTLMRNITVQAAEPPLGYPIFNSEPVMVPTL